MTLAFAQELAASPALFPHALDLVRRQLGFLRLREADYARASFLDGRDFPPGGALIPAALADVTQAMAHVPPRCDFIFHIGHAGSTLIARLLGANPGVFSLREPGVLRPLMEGRAQPGFDPVLDALMRLFSRRFRAQSLPVVKATSFVSEIGQAILARYADTRALLLYTDAPTYLATILGAAHSPKETVALADMRFSRLLQRLGPSLQAHVPKSLGEGVAMSWACEMLALKAAASAAPARVMWLDFERFLDAPQEELTRIFGHFAVPVSAHDVSAILSSGEMARYAKAPEHPYDRALRQAVLADAREFAGGEIARGLAWLDHAAEKFPALAAVYATPR